MKAFYPEGLSCSFFSSKLALASPFPSSAQSRRLSSSLLPRRSTLEPEASALASSSHGFCQWTSTHSGPRSSSSSREPLHNSPTATSSRHHPHKPPPHSCPKASSFSSTHRLDVRQSPTPSWEPGPLGKRGWARQSSGQEAAALLTGGSSRCLHCKVPGELQSTGPDLQGVPGPQGLRRLLLSKSGHSPLTGRAPNTGCQLKGSTKAPRPAARLQAGPHPGSHGARPSPTATGTRHSSQAVGISA